MLGQRIAMPLHQLVALGAPLQAIENEITVIKRSQEIAALHGVTGASGSGTNEPFERNKGGAPHVGFEHRLGGDAVLALRKDEKQSECDGADRAELETLAPWTDKRRKAVFGVIDDAASDKSVPLQLQSDNGPQQRRDGFRQSQRLPESFVTVTFEGERADQRPPAICEHGGHHRSAWRARVLR